MTLNNGILIDHYERLRIYGFKNINISIQVYGLGVMMQKGLKAWMEVFSDHFETNSFHADANESLNNFSPLQRQLSGIMADIIIKKKGSYHGSDFKDNCQTSQADSVSVHSAVYS